MSDKPCCANCKYFRYEGAYIDNPYPEFWCVKDRWDSIQAESELYEPIKCEFFIDKGVDLIREE